MQHWSTSVDQCFFLIIILVRNNYRTMRKTVLQNHKKTVQIQNNVYSTLHFTFIHNVKSLENP